MSYGDRNENKDLEQFNELLEVIRGWFNKNQRGVYLILPAILLLLWLGSGVYIVQPGEEGVVQTFGRYQNTTQAGLNYHFPWPIQNVTIVNVEQIRRAEIGFRSTRANAKQEVLSEALMLTEDENIVQVELLVQYRISNSRDFVFNVQNPEDVLPL